MWVSLCHGLYELPIFRTHITATRWLFNDRTSKATTSEHSSDIHSQNRKVTVVVSHVLELNTLPILRLCITLSRSLFNYPIYRTTNRLCSIKTQCNVLPFEYLLPSMMVFITMWTYWQSFRLITPLPFHKVEGLNIVAVFALTMPPRS